MLLIWHVMALLSLANISCRSKKYKDRLRLSPSELIDLVRKEQYKNRVPYVPGSKIKTDAPYKKGDYTALDDIEPDISEADCTKLFLFKESCEDNKILKRRKVWSRWSKWGECSVTCGSGTTERHRICVAGRCAHGEREEQHRPCAKVPCNMPFYNMTDELRELE